MINKKSKKFGKRFLAHILLELFKKFKSKPKKIFVRKELEHGDYSYIDSYLKILITLEIIEKVPAVYYTGKKYRARRDVKGYRLKQDSREVK